MDVPPCLLLLLAFLFLALFFCCLPGTEHASLFPEFIHSFIGTFSLRRLPSIHLLLLLLLLLFSIISNLASTQAASQTLVVPLPSQQKGQGRLCRVLVRRSVFLFLFTINSSVDFADESCHAPQMHIRGIGCVGFVSLDNLEGTCFLCCCCCCCCGGIKSVEQGIKL